MVNPQGEGLVDLIETQRLLLFDDGRCLGCFTTRDRHAINDLDQRRGGSSHDDDHEGNPWSPPQPSAVSTAILLEENGASFTHIASDGKVHRHLTRFPLHHLAKRVETLVHFRNRHRPRPYLSSRFYPKKVASQDMSGRVQWPKWDDEEEEQSGKEGIRSLEGKAQVRLEYGPPGLVLHARFLAEVPGDDPISAQYSAPNDRLTQSYLTWVDQIYRPHHTPQAFTYPTALLLQRDPPPSSQDVKLPDPLPLDPPADWSDLDSGHGLLAFDLLEMSRDPHRFPTRGRASAIVVEENEDGLYWARVNADGRPVVDVWVQRDGSYLRLEGDFVYHVRGANATTEGSDKVYHLDAVKTIRVPNEDGTWYDLGPIAHHASCLVSQYSASPSPTLSASPQPLGPPPSLGHVIEEVTVSGVGVFRAFSCGRVRVRFNDRTILDLLPSEGLCRLLLPDAQDVEIPLNRWEGPDEEYYTRYGSVAVQFARWAFLSPAERDRREAEARERSSWISQEVRRSHVHVMQYRIAKAVLEGQSPALPQPTTTTTSSTMTQPSWVQPAPPSTQRQRQQQALEVISLIQKKNQAHMTEVKHMLRKSSVAPNTSL